MSDTTKAVAAVQYCASVMKREIQQLQAESTGVVDNFGIIALNQEWHRLCGLVATLQKVKAKGGEFPNWEYADGRDGREESLPRRPPPAG